MTKILTRKWWILHCNMCINACICMYRLAYANALAYSEHSVYIYSYEELGMWWEFRQDMCTLTGATKMLNTEDLASAT